jgi:cephalosporin hydroxylase
MSVPIGTYSLERDQLPVSAEDEQIVRQFHDLYHRRWLRQGADTINLNWFGYETVKCPLDLSIYHDLLVKTRPDVVIETGTWFGGSALYLAMVLEQIGHGKVIIIDVEPKGNRPEHDRIRYVTGSSTDPAIIAEVTKQVAGSRAMVILDSDHRASFVHDERMAYSPLVQLGDYIIVEDTDVNGHPTWPNFGPGPMQAVEKFLAGNDEFVVDRRCEDFLMTLNPAGYFRRCKPRSG